MSNANESSKGKFDRLHEVIAKIGALMAEFPKDSPAITELEQHRKSIMGLVYGDVTNTLGQEKTEDTSIVLAAQNSVAETRLLRARQTLDGDLELAQLISDSQALKEMRASRG